MATYNVYETRQGWGPAFMRGVVRAASVRWALRVAALKWGKGKYAAYRIQGAAR